jgi:hypothetical protein
MTNKCQLNKECTESNWGLSLINGIYYWYTGTKGMP